MVVDFVKNTLIYADHSHAIPDALLLTRFRTGLSEVGRNTRENHSRVYIRASVCLGILNSVRIIGD
jgi:hypothetical protein